MSRRLGSEFQGRFGNQTVLNRGINFQGPTAPSYRFFAILPRFIRENRSKTRRHTCLYSLEKHKSQNLGLLTNLMTPLFQIPPAYMGVALHRI